MTPYSLQWPPEYLVEGTDNTDDAYEERPIPHQKAQRNLVVAAAVAQPTNTTSMLGGPL